MCWQFELIQYFSNELIFLHFIFERNDSRRLNMKRRSLFIICFAVSVLGVTGFSSVNPALNTHHLIQETGISDMHDMIGCLIGDIDQDKAPAGLPDVRGYDITFSESFDRDLTHQPCSAFVIDKQLIGKSAWDKYADFFHEFHNDTPLMIVDNIRDWLMSSKVNIKR
jgi:hypothetical protein